MALTFDRLRQYLHYDPKTGVFTRLIDSKGGRFKAGTIAGSVTHDGRFRCVWIDGTNHLEHRLVWLWMKGAFPRYQIDHKNLNGIDNRWDNLREATISQNAMNRRGRSKSGAKGVYSVSKEKGGSKRWKSSIAKEGQSHHLGLFLTRDEAKAAYDAAAILLHGEFARLV